MPLPNQSVESALRLFVSELESNLGPFAAEYGPKRTYDRQNKAKRTNKIDFPSLAQNQGVRGSNPLRSTSQILGWLRRETAVETEPAVGLSTHRTSTI